MKHTTKGFTLVEVTITIAVMAILAAVAVPVFSAFTDRTVESMCAYHRALVVRTEVLSHHQYGQHPITLPESSGKIAAAKR